MGKTTFLRKKPMSDIGRVVGTNLIRGGSVVAAASIDGLISPKITNENVKKVIGPAAFLLGMAGEIFIENPLARAVPEGIGAYGALKCAKDFIPDTVKAKIGLAGLGSTTIEVDGTPDWEALARKAELNSSNEGRSLEENYREELPFSENNQRQAVGRTSEQAISDIL